MLENNTHVTGDNKGVSSYLFEQASLTDPTAAPGFVAGFSQANVGDTTPNILGAWCDNGSGEMCTFENSTCDGVSETCHGRGLSHSISPNVLPFGAHVFLGPEFQKLDLGVSSCYQIGRRVFAGAQALYVRYHSVDLLKSWI
jgi:neutral ceramidase